tara:strand:+ start:664 stop:1623 length:960 start_codon:yes stop_codon:yes gene_type:complete
MKFFITGVAGMIGAHFLELILREGHEAVGIDNLSVGKRENIKDFLDNEKFSFYELDLLDKKEKILNKINNCDVVVHLAAIKKVSENQEAFPTLNVNVKSTEVILDYALKFKKKVIFASTSDVYGLSEDLPFKESSNSVIGPSTAKRWAYAVSKLYCEQMCMAYQKEFRMDILILRYFGGFSEKSSFTWSGGHITLFIDQILNGKPVTIHGDGLQTRSIGHGSDLAKGTYLASKSDISGEIINIGNNEELSVIDTVKLLSRLMNIDLDTIKIEYIPDEIVFGDYKDVRRRVPDLSKAKKLLNYSPSVSTEDAIKLVLDKI